MSRAAGGNEECRHSAFNRQVESVVASRMKLGDSRYDVSFCVLDVGLVIAR